MKTNRVCFLRLKTSVLWKRLQHRLVCMQDSDEGKLRGEERGHVGLNRRSEADGVYCSETSEGCQLRQV